MSGKRDKYKHNYCQNDPNDWVEEIVAARYANAKVKPRRRKAEEQPRADKMVKTSRNKGL